MHTITVSATVQTEFFHCYVEGFYIFDVADNTGAYVAAISGDVSGEFGKPLWVPFGASLKYGLSTGTVTIRGGRIAQDELSD